MRRRITFDLDGTLCTNEQGNYACAQPIPERIARVRQEYDAGTYIVIDSSRGQLTDVDWLDATDCQLKTWGVPYHELRVGMKPFAHVYVGDEAVNADDYFANRHVERWPDDYFAKRTGNDPRRMKAFASEAMFMHDSGVWLEGPVCDVGCSTGEFLNALRWPVDQRFGMEISKHARAIAESNGVSFSHDITNSRAFFDCVIFRGTIQHVPHPFRYIELAHRALKSGGHIVFLQTPNTASVVYRLFEELPVSDDARNYWMPSAKTLSNALTNFGFEIVAIDYPYLDGGYARPFHDALQFARRLIVGGPTNFPWPGNMMNVLARKP